MRDEGVQLAMDLPKGALNRISFTLHHDRSVGWSVRVWHRHDGELAMCPYISTYEKLTLTEAIDVLCESVLPANGQYEVREGRCSPAT